MKAWIEVERLRNCYSVVLMVPSWDDKWPWIGSRKTHEGALNLANRWAEYLGGLEVKDLTEQE